MKESICSPALQSLSFTPCLAKPEKGKDVEDEVPAHKMTEQNDSARFVGEVETP